MVSLMARCFRKNKTRRITAAGFVVQESIYCVTN